MIKYPLSHFLEEADRILPHLTPEERRAWAVHCEATHPGLTEDHKTLTIPTPSIMSHDNNVTLAEHKARLNAHDTRLDDHHLVQYTHGRMHRVHGWYLHGILVWLAILTVLLIVFASRAHAQDPAQLPQVVRFVASDPTGNACGFGSPILYFHGNVYTCSNGATYAQLTGGGGSGCTLGAVSNGQVVYDNSGNCAGVPSGNAGQIYISQGAGQPPVVADPIVSFNYTTLFSAISATGTQTSSAIRIPLLSAYGTLAITGASITGSPSACQIALEAQTNVGTPASAAIATQAFTPANSYQSFAITPTAGFGGADQMIAVYTCSVYPSTGTITAVWDPAQASALTLPLPTGANTIGAVNQGGSWVVGQSGTWNQNLTALNSVALGSPSNYGTSPGAVNVPGVNAFITNTPAVTATIQSNASVNLNQEAGVALGAPSNYGISPGAVAVPGVNAFVTNTPPVSQSGTWTVQPGNTANTTPWLATIQQGGNAAAVTATNALKVDGSAVTQPVSITLSDTTNSGTLGALNNVVTVNLVGSDSCSFTLATGNNLSAILTPEFSSDGGTTWNPTYLRFSTGSTNWITTLIASSTAGTFNIFVPGGAGIARVRVSTYTSGSASTVMRAVTQVENVGITQGTPNTALPPIATLMAGTDGTNIVPPYVDPCQRTNRLPFNINQTTGTQLITGTSSKKTYICNLWIAPLGAATNIAIVEGTGSVCATNTISVSGSGGGGAGTAATGSILAINEGFSVGTGGYWVMITTVAADNVCLLQSAANQISGGGSYVQF